MLSYLLKVYLYYNKPLLLQPLQLQFQAQIRRRYQHEVRCLEKMTYFLFHSCVTHT